MQKKIVFGSLSRMLIALAIALVLVFLLPQLLGRYTSSQKADALEKGDQEILDHLDKNGFGIKLEKRASAYLPPHWHYAVELLLFIRGKVTCKFSHTTMEANGGDIYIINSKKLNILLKK